MHRRLARIFAPISIVMVVVGVMSSSAVAVTVGPTPKLSWQTGGASHSGEPAGRVLALAPTAGREYLGGRFTTVRPGGVSLGGAGTVTRNHLAAFDASGNLVTSWNPNVSGPVEAIAVAPDGTVFAGGEFATVAGVSHKNLVAIDPTTGVAKSWAPAPNGAVRSLLVSNGMLYVGGEFTSISGQSRLRLAAYNLATLTLSSAWKPKADKAVKGLAATANGAGEIVAVGSFTTIDGSAQPRLAVLRASDGAVRSLLDHPPYYADAVAVTATQILVGEGGPGGKVQAFDLATGSLRWTAQLDGDVQAITVRDDSVYAGGHFINYCVGGTGTGAPFQCDQAAQAIHLIAFSLSTGTLAPWAPAPNGSLGVFALSTTSTGITAGGEFTVVNGVRQQGYARFAI